MYDDITWVKSRSGYYQSTVRNEGRKVWLHQYVYEKYNGPQLRGFSVHHVDFNKDNNSIDNLVLLNKSEHSSLHIKRYFSKLENREKQKIHLNKIRPDHVWPLDEKEKEIFRQHLKVSMSNIKPIIKFCEYCGHEYSVKPLGTSRFCSNKCKSAWRRKEGLDNIERDCPICGKFFFTNKYRGSKTCSRHCGDVLRGRTLYGTKS